jgi:hypothetical protein
MAKAIIATTLMCSRSPLPLECTPTQTWEVSSVNQDHAILTNSFVYLQAVFEWIITIDYSFYLLAFWCDLRLSKGVNKGDLAPGRPSALRGEMREADDSAQLAV